MKLKTISVVKYLSKRYGGKWKYDSAAYQWNCDDGIRYVHRVATGRDMNGEYTGVSSACMYYRDGSKSPEWVCV